jgi:capsular polysaccharide biosynthesis protein
MQLRDYWTTIRRRAWLVVLLPAVVVAVSTYLALRGPGAYCSNMTLAVSMTPQSGAPRGLEYYPPYWETLTSEYLADDLTVVLKSQAFAQDVSAELGYSLEPGLIVAATRTKKTHRTIDLSICGQEPGTVAAVGEAYERTLNTRLGEYFRQLQTENVQVRVINRPTLGRASSLGGLAAELGLRAMLGLALALALAFLLDYLDDRLRDRREMEKLLGLPVLAEIPPHRGALSP